jgi:hypothetical protein
VSGGLVGVTTAAPKKRAPSRATPRKKISKLLRKLEAKMGDETPKASLGDFIRLVQLEKELADGETPREVKVTWVEPPKASESEK